MKPIILKFNRATPHSWIRHRQERPPDVMGANASSELPPMDKIDFETFTGDRYTTEVPNTRVEPNRGPVYFHSSFPLPEAKLTLYHNFLHGAAIDNGARPLYGTRKIVDGKVGPYEWISYGAVKARMDALASGMAQICGLKRQDAVGLFTKNRMEWCLTSHACDRMSYMLVPLYDTLGPDAVPYIVNHTELTVLLCGSDQFQVFMDSKDACPTVKFVIQFEDVSEEQRRLAASKGVVLKSLKEVEDLGRICPLPADAPSPQDIATLCYTSGTTGNPKGVILTHRNVASSSEVISERVAFSPGDVHLSYLPLPHVFERAVMTALIRNGAAAGFYQGDVLFLMDDMAELKPTIFISVPRLFNRVYDKIIQGVAAAGGLKKILFDQAVAAKKAALVDGHKTHALWDALIFSKIRMVLGGRVRLIVSGSAPLSADVKDFFKLAFSCDILEGYGLSETSAILSLSTIEMPLGPHVGPPIANALVRLEDVPEMNYTSNDKPRPRGEILVKGPFVFGGYYREPEKTAEALDADGWFHTGDIGCWNADGTISIIDRKKNIFKLSQGEYVAAEKIENVYAKSKFVAQIFVYGDSFQNYLVAVVVPDPEVTEAWAQSQGLPKDIAKLAGDAKFQAAVLEDMDREGKTAQLRGFEFVKRVHFCPEPFSVDKGLITPSFKLRRPQLKEYFQPQISAMYA